MSPRLLWTWVDLEGELGESKPVKAFYRICPAEPDVGIPREYVEFDHAETPDGKHYNIEEEEIDLAVDQIEQLGMEEDYDGY